MKYFAKVSAKEIQIEIGESDNGIFLIVNGKPRHTEFARVGSDNLFSLIVENRSHQLFFEETDKGHWVSVDGHKFLVELEDEKTRLIRRLIKSDDKPQGLTEIKAPMPGLIINLFVKENQPVKKGDGLVIIEAMKMENEIQASAEGTVKKIIVNEADSVDKGAVLIVMK